MSRYGNNIIAGQVHDDLEYGSAEIHKGMDGERDDDTG